jgi:hypothetical protein
MTAGVTWELMRGGDVRVLIPLKTSSADAIALLRKIISWIEQSGGKEKIVPAAPRAADSAHSKED